MVVKAETQVDVGWIVITPTVGGESPRVGTEWVWAKGANRENSYVASNRRALCLLVPWREKPLGLLVTAVVLYGYSTGNSYGTGDGTGNSYGAKTRVHQRGWEFELRLSH
jgi:hypothetical protein